MSDQLVVDTEAMRAHARALEPIAAGLAEARSAAASTALPDTSFGLLCSFLVPPALVLQGSAAAGVVAGSSAVSGTGAAVSASADAYDAIDEAVSTALDTFRELLP
ncbi:type VII secretion target [Cellulomonas sp. Marseille-Q8402]